jgi:hypothetical protein
VASDATGTSEVTAAELGTLRQVADAYRLGAPTDVAVITGDRALEA